MKRLVILYFFWALMNNGLVVWLINVDRRTWASESFLFRASIHSHLHCDHFVVQLALFLVLT